MHDAEGQGLEIKSAEVEPAAEITAHIAPKVVAHICAKIAVHVSSITSISSITSSIAAEAAGLELFGRRRARHPAKHR